jgi:hypothetical protein
VDGGIFEHLLWIVAVIEIIYITNKYNQSISHLSYLHTFCKVTFKQLYLHTHWKLGTCLHELIYLE